MMGVEGTSVPTGEVGQRKERTEGEEGVPEPVRKGH